MCPTLSTAPSSNFNVSNTSLVNLLTPLDVTPLYSLVVDDDRMNRQVLKRSTLTFREF
jgi:hypothetical protein